MLIKKEAQTHPHAHRYPIAHSKRYTRIQTHTRSHPNTLQAEGSTQQQLANLQQENARFKSAGSALQAVARRSGVLCVCLCEISIVECIATTHKDTHSHTHVLSQTQKHTHSTAPTSTSAHPAPHPRAPLSHLRSYSLLFFFCSYTSCSPNLNESVHLLTHTHAVLLLQALQRTLPLTPELLQGLKEGLAPSQMQIAENSEEQGAEKATDGVFSNAVEGFEQVRVCYV